MKFSIKNFLSKFDQIRRKLLQILSHLLKKSLMENFIFCAVDYLDPLALKCKFDFWVGILSFLIRKLFCFFENCKVGTESELTEIYTVKKSKSSIEKEQIYALTSLPKIGKLYIRKLKEIIGLMRFLNCIWEDSKSNSKFIAFMLRI